MIRGSLTRAQWHRAGALAAAVAALHVIGFGSLLLLVIPHHFALGGAGGLGFGLGLTAYTLGLRHAFDADHIAAIDNTTRKLMSEGKRPLGVGFFFSLGHSTVVFAVALVLSLGLHAGGAQAAALPRSFGAIGSSISGLFLYAIAAVNVATLLGIVRAFRRLRGGCELDQQELERALGSGGLMNRVLGRFATRVRSSWHMYPVGMLFGLGFDTASEIALLFLAGGAATSGLPVYAILPLPVIFAAGMSLLDTLDGSFMNLAYGWAFSKPVRKLYYNLTITGLSVLVAFAVGSLELLSIAAQELGLHGGIWTWIGSLDLNTIGYAIVGLFVLTWALAVAVWRIGRIEERLTSNA